MSRFLSLLLVITLITVSCPAVLADRINFKNGDRLTGKIVKKDGDKIIIETESAGIVTILWSAVESIVANEAVNVEREDGELIKGTIATKDEDTFEVGTEDGNVEVERNDVKAVRSDAEQTAFEKEQERINNPGIFDLWSGSVDIGLDIKRGNEPHRKIRIGGNATRTTKRSVVLVHVDGYQQEKLRNGVNQITDQDLTFTIKAERYISERRGYFVMAGYENDKNRDLNYRVSSGGGYTYDIFRSDNNHLKAFGGAVYTTEGFQGGIERKAAEVTFGQRLDLRLNKTVSLEQRSAFFVNVTGVKQFRIAFNSALVTRLNTWLAWQITLRDDYDSNPVTSNKNDLRFTTGLRIMFGKKRQ